MSLSTRAPLGMLLVVIVLVAGCKGPSHQEETKLALMMIGLQYHRCCDGLGRPPVDREEFLEYQDPFGALSGSGDGELSMLDLDPIVILCGTEVSRDTPNRESTILGYHKDVPEQGGYVVFADGGAELVSAEKFAELMKPSNTEGSE